MSKILLFLICLFVFIPVKTAEAVAILCSGGSKGVSIELFMKDHEVIFAGKKISDTEESTKFQVLKSYRGLRSSDFYVTVFKKDIERYHTLKHNISVSNLLGNGVLVGANYNSEGKLEYKYYSGSWCNVSKMGFSIEELEKELANEGAGIYISRTNFTYIFYLLSFSLFMTLSLIIYKIIRGLKRKL